MTLSIRNPIAEKLVRQIAAISGENLTQAIISALEKRLQELQFGGDPEDLVREIMNISKQCRAIPDRDSRSPDEILEYNDYGGLDAWS